MPDVSLDTRIDHLQAAIQALEAKIAATPPPTPPDLHLANNLDRLATRVAALEDSTNPETREALLRSLSDEVATKAAASLRASIKAEVARVNEATLTATGTALGELKKAIREEVRQAVAGVIATAQEAQAGSTSGIYSAKAVLLRESEDYTSRCRGYANTAKASCRSVIDAINKDLAAPPAELRFRELALKNPAELLRLGIGDNDRQPISERIARAHIKSKAGFDDAANIIQNARKRGEAILTMVKDWREGKEPETPQDARLSGIHAAILTLMQGKLLPSIRPEQIADELEAGILRGFKSLAAFEDSDLPRYRSTAKVAVMGCELSLWAKVAESDDKILRAEAVVKSKGLGTKYRAARDQHKDKYGRSGKEG